MGPVLSVLIPSKNRPDRVERLVASVRGQDFDEPLEVIVVDDGSVPPLSFADPSIQLRRNETSLGACAARNRGFEMVSGEFILMLDDDTELADPTLVRRAVDLARSHPDFAAIGFRHLDSNGVPDPWQPAVSDVTCETAFFYGYGVLLRREAIRQTDGFEETFGYGYEEQDLCLQLHRAGWRVMFAPSLALLHHHDPRGRNWVRIHRLISRNAIRSMLLRFPLFSVLPCATLKWLSYFVESRRRGENDWSGGLRMFMDTLAFVPHALGRRQPMRLRTLSRYRQLKLSPQPITEMEAASVS